MSAPSSFVAPSCLVLGDSFVERLRRFTREKLSVAGRGLNLGGTLEKRLVSYESGDEEITDYSIIRSPACQFVVLSVGSKDVSVCDANLSRESSVFCGGSS